MTESPHRLRATVRYRLDPPPPAGSPPLTDAVGWVLSNGPDEIVLETRREVVRVPRRLVVATRIIPPPPPRRGVIAGQVEPLALHRLAAGGWPAMETAALGEWLLRASHGFTSRGNSVVPVGDPGHPLEEAVAEVERWYAYRGLPPNLTIAGPVGFEVGADPLGALLLARGYAASAPCLFLTGATGDVRALAAGPAESGVAIELGEELTTPWLNAYGGYRSGDERAARAILTGSPAQVFATGRAATTGQVVAVGRLGMSGDWGGLAAMWVDPAYRRRGIATAMIAQLSGAAERAEIANLHLQVWADNSPAHGLYQRVGFRSHHAYLNLSRDRADSSRHSTDCPGDPPRKSLIPRSPWLSAPR